MWSDLFDINKCIQVNNLQEVTNPILLEKDNNPTTDGLLSYEIFGRSTRERSTTFAYIDLHGHFLNPLVYKTWKRLNRGIEGIVAGLETYSVNNKGELVKDPDGWTGLEELYNHFDQIKFKKSNSDTQNTRISFISSLKKDEVFVTKWLVCPPFYRDIQLNNSKNNKISIHERTKLYGDILRMSKALQNDVTGIPIITASTRNRIQQLLLDCYTNQFMKDIKGKTGIFRRSVMGKSVDYSARFVITSPLFDVDKPSDMTVDFEHAGLPLSGACTCFFPFIIKWLKDYFQNEIFLRKDKYPVMKKDGTIDYVKIDIDKFNDEYFTKAVDSYIHSYANRFKTIDLPNNKGYNLKLTIVGRYVSPEKVVKNESSHDSGIMRRAMTWTDLLYMAAVEVCKDKHILITRYPLEDYFGIYPCKITVLSTLRTVPMIISGKLYKEYPVCDPKADPTEVTSMFRDSLCQSNLYLKGLGGDYDGDQETVRGVWDINANKECDKQIYEKRNLLNIAGQLIRTTEKEAIQTFYSLTCNPDEITKFVSNQKAMVKA